MFWVTEVEPSMALLNCFVVTSSLSPLPPSLSLRADNGGAADGAVVRGNA